MVSKVIQTIALFLKLCIGYLLGNIIVHIPCLHRAIMKQMDRKASIVMPIENYWRTLFTWPMMKTLWKYERCEIYKASTVDQAAPNPKLILADYKDVIHGVYLHDLVQGTRPLVVVFGSWTCPVFIERLNQLHAIHQEFSTVADFIVVYVEEAHPDNGWRMENNFIIRKHKSTQDRINASQRFRSLLSKDIPLYVDPIENEASKSYSGCPNRIIAIKGTTLTYQNGPGPTYYYFDGIKNKLRDI